MTDAVTDLPDDAPSGPPPASRKKADRQCTGSRSVNGCRLRWDMHKKPYCRWCGRPNEHHLPDDLDLEVQGRARMAAARQAAGSPLDALDQEALDATQGRRGSLLT